MTRLSRPRKPDPKVRVHYLRGPVDGSVEDRAGPAPLLIVVVNRGERGRDEAIIHRYRRTVQVGDEPEQWCYEHEGGVVA